MGTLPSYRRRWSAVVPGLLTLKGWIAVPLITLIGLVWLVTAHTPQVVRVSGVVKTVSDVYSHDQYQRTEVVLRDDSRTYNFERDTLKPAIPADQPSPGGTIVLWIDPSFNWKVLGTTEILALSLASDEFTNRPAHTTKHFDDPSSQLWDQRVEGAMMLGFAILILGFGALLQWLSMLADRRPSKKTAVRR